MSKYADIKEDLLGRTIESIAIDKAKDKLTVRAGGLEFNYSVEGDCCSRSWIEHLEGVESVIGQEVTGVEQLDMNENEDSKKHCERCEGSDVLKIYQVLIKTPKGTSTLEFRNDSNGYYGGCLIRLN